MSEKPTYPHPLDIGTHFCQALADGRYDKWVPSWEKRKHQISPTDVPRKGMLFGGQIPMDDEPNDQRLAHADENLSTTPKNDR